MIITQLTGGLGNQMFQYALGYILSTKNQDDLYLDLAIFADNKNGDTPRPYEMDIFKIGTPDCTVHDRIRLGDENPIIGMINRVFHTHLNADPPTLVKESGHHFSPSVLTMKGDLYLRGFWQTDKYFREYRDQILKIFTFRKKISKQSTQTLREIESKNSIAVHVRRGDYLSNPAAKKYHGLCNPSYYQKAAVMIAKKIECPVFYVFSDDPEWCQSNLKFGGKTVFVTHNSGGSSWQDMRLMTACQHHIIANSSFSWWGAWLCQNAQKIVIAPKKWLATSSTQMDDICPSEWIRL